MKKNFAKLTLTLLILGTLGVLVFHYGRTALDFIIKMHGG